MTGINNTNIMPTAPFQQRPSLRVVSKRMFFLAGYSLTSAALMGSSIGLLIYQSRQFYFLHRFSHTNQMFHHHHHDNHFKHGGNQDTSGQLDQKWDSSDDSSFVHDQHSRHFHDNHGHQHKSLQSLFFSTWLPILIWFGSLLTSSVLIAFRKWVPRVISPRTGILVSQSIFAFFWILLGAMQEVQEHLMSQQRLARSVDPIAEAMDDSNQFDVAYEARTEIRAMMWPLGTVWYLTVILLGLATGLLTASSSQMEKQLQSEFDEAFLEENVDVQVPADEKEMVIDDTTASSRENQTKDYDVNQQLSTVPIQRQDSQMVSEKSSFMRYTTTQRVQLGMLMIVLFMVQLKLFKWVIQAQSMRSFFEGTSTSISLPLILIGLFTGFVMTTLGVHFLPKATSTTFAQ
ncbi:hypothetical protein FBU30_010205 [Linnemannia zychae]|nr:hypothetical protein FBU30_010205 [Linnemannia zychae]